MSPNLEITTKDTWKAHVMKILPYKTASLWYIWSEGYANEGVPHQGAAATLGKRVPPGDAKDGHHGKNHL